MKKILNIIKKLAPWAVAVAIFWYLFRQYPPEKVWTALKLVNKPAFFSFAAFYFFFCFFIDSFSMTKVISRFSHKVNFKDIFVARGVTYLIMIINYPASQAAFAYYLKRKYDIAIFKALGIFFYIMFIDLVWVITLALAGSFYQEIVVGGVDLGETVRGVAIVAYGITILWIAFWRRVPERILRRKTDIKLLSNLRERKIFHIFNKATVVDYFRVALLRSPIHMTIIGFMYVVLITFNAQIPFGKIVGNVPVVFMIGTLPITPGGLGTTNAAMVALLSPYISSPAISSGIITASELIFAATILWMFSNYALKAIFGTLIFAFSSAKDLFTKGPSTREMENEVPEIHENF